MLENGCLKPVRPGRVVEIAVGVFVRVGHRQFIFRVEIMIDLAVDLLARKSSGRDAVAWRSENALRSILLIA